MSLHMLHTDIATCLIRGNTPALDKRIASAAPEELCISAVTRGELLCGISQQMLQTIVRQPSAASRIDPAAAAALRKTTHSVLAKLTPREARTLRMRFGIDTNAGHTLENVGKQFDMTRERIMGQEQADHLSRLLDHFLSRVPCLPWDAVAATHFATVAVELHRAGTPMGTMDTMIAGHAIAVGAVLITQNERHFSGVSGLKIENWTKSHTRQ